MKQMPAGLVDKTRNIALFRAYPRLEQQLPYVALAELPTPVEPMACSGDLAGLASLYLKRDDLSGDIYGSNKVRKLEFLLGDALRRKARAVLTLGYAGSNHALATALYAARVGLRSTSLLLPQVNAHYVRRNLLAGYAAKAELQYYSNLFFLGAGIVSNMLRGRLADGIFPRFIPAGGTCPLGIAAYVSAALELHEQINAGELPEPDYIYVPLGSMGTAIGLTLGLRAVGRKTRVIAVRVLEEKMVPPRKMLKLLRETAAFLHRLDDSFPRLKFTRTDLTIRNEYLGAGYAQFTAAAVQAAALLAREKGIILNGAYSAKAFAALLGEARRQDLRGRHVLYWNTYNTRDLSALTAGIDWRQLPEPFHRYFTEDVQPLDNGSDR